MFVKWRPVDTADHWEKIRRCCSPAEVYAYWWCMHTIVAWEWKMDREVGCIQVLQRMVHVFHVRCFPGHTNWNILRQQIHNEWMDTIWTLKCKLPQDLSNTQILG